MVARSSHDAGRPPTNDQEGRHSWNQGVRGLEVLELINADGEIVRAEAGPGSGKTFGLVRRVHRILYPDGYGARGTDVLVVAFNRVIARDLTGQIEAELKRAGVSDRPLIRTVHALCLQVIGGDIRILLPHEREAMLYDVLQGFPTLANRYETFRKADQALRDHEAGHQEHTSLWQAVGRCLTAHRARLISDLPPMLLDHVKGGDFGDRRYSFVIVDEFQDLTPGEQELFYRLRAPGGQLVAVGDSRQSIYAFRGNDRQGLRRLDAWATDAAIAATDVPLRECHRCPARVVHAANQLMSLSDSEVMIPVSEVEGNVHVVHWRTPNAEATGMAEKIGRNLQQAPDESHLVMVTRRQFGFWFRDALIQLQPDLRVDLSFEEGLLDLWPVREAFLLFCLLVDPDPPSWRAWLGYQTPSKRRSYKAPKRNAEAYLRLRKPHRGGITEEVVRALVDEPRGRSRGSGGQNLWDRAKRFLTLSGSLLTQREQPGDFLDEAFSEELWLTGSVEAKESAAFDLGLLKRKAQQLLEEIEGEDEDGDPLDALAKTARALRYKIGTREPFVPEEGADIRVSTLWGAKGVTADHAYVLGLCDEAMPGVYRPEYPGSEEDFIEEQRRLFYVSITRTRRSLVLSRPEQIHASLAARLGMRVETSRGMAVLSMSRFLRDVRGFFPPGKRGEDWTDWPAGISGSSPPCVGS